MYNVKNGVHGAPSLVDGNQLRCVAQQEADGGDAQGKGPNWKNTAGP